MLPECRTGGNIYTVPKFDVSEVDINGFINELRGFHSAFSDCFSRSEPRENFYRYMIGQFSEAERKSIEPIAVKVEGGNVRAMQRAVSDAVWNETKMLPKYRYMVNDDMGDPNGVLIFDESGFVKKGNDSVGVAKQYCGTVGKVENSQVGVFAAYASRYGYALVGKRLFIPEKWFGEDYRDRRYKCKMPESIGFKTKPQLAADIFQEIENENTLPFKYIVADTLYGNSPDFMDVIEKCIDKTYLVSIPNDSYCWLKEPITRTKKYKYKGKIQTKLIVEETEKKPIMVKTMAENINDYFWYKRKVSEGTKGPIEYEFTKREVVLSKDGIPWKTVWLVIRRTLEEKPTYSYYASNAPVSTRLNIFVWLSGIRWAIEQCFEETKSELGMDQYEVRKYRGWNHHILTCMLGHFFLWHLKIKLGKKNTSYYSIAA